MRAPRVVARRHAYSSRASQSRHRPPRASCAAQRHGRRLDQQPPDVRHDVVRTDQNKDAKLAQQTSERVQARGARREPRRPQAVQRRDRLGARPSSPGRRESPRCDSLRGAPSRRCDRSCCAGRRAAHHARAAAVGVAERLELSGPVVSGPAGFEHDGRRRLLREEREERSRVSRRSSSTMAWPMRHATWNTDFARSTAMVVCSIWAPPRRGLEEAVAPGTMMPHGRRSPFHPLAADGGGCHHDAAAAEAATSGRRIAV